MTSRTFTIVCRSSPLAVIQAERARSLIQSYFPDVTIQTLTKDSAGDKNRQTPLYALEGRDFFTKDIDDYLLSGEADFAVHSLKDLSLERTENPTFASAYFERDDPRDVVLFAGNIAQKLSSRSTTIRLGTSSLRRAELIPPFLQKALPRPQTLPSNEAFTPTRVVCEPMRGNVDSRLKQLAEGKFDGIVLAAAGLNRLLASKTHGAATREVLNGFRWMLLPLVECPPAPGQGALIIEALAENADAVRVLEQMRNAALEADLQPERSLLRDFGGGCHQRFGAVSMHVGNERVLIANGKDEDGNSVELMRFTMPTNLETRLRQGKPIFAASDFMKDFFTTSYEAVAEDFSFPESAAFVSHHRAAHKDPVLRELRRKRVWTAGTRTWFELAKRGVWVEGCSDGFGFRSLHDVFSSPLVGVKPDEIRILTNTESARDWQNDGATASGLYTLHDNLSEDIIHAVREADTFFWTSFGQYRACKPHLAKLSDSEILHLCPAGRTATVFRENGIEPLTFPSIKAFLIWQKNQH